MEGILQLVDERRVVASGVSTPLVADFLSSLQGLAPNTVEGYRSAISETLKHLRGAQTHAFEGF